MNIPHWKLPFWRTVDDFRHPEYGLVYATHSGQYPLPWVESQLTLSPMAAASFLKGCVVLKQLASSMPPDSEKDLNAHADHGIETFMSGYCGNEPISIGVHHPPPPPDWLFAVAIQLVSEAGSLSEKAQEQLMGLATQVAQIGLEAARR